MVFAGYVGIPSFVDILQTIIYSIISWSPSLSFLHYIIF
jgi:hypothetical protein